MQNLARLALNISKRVSSCPRFI